MGLLVLDDAEEGSAEIIPAGERSFVLGGHQADDAFAFKILVAFHERLDRFLQFGVKGLAAGARVHFGERTVKCGDPCAVFAARGDVEG